MAGKNNVEFRVGVIILIGLVILVASLYWLQGYKLERNAQRVRVKFADVGTLSVGDPVTVSGVHKGKVNHLALTDTGVEVELLLYRDVVLRQDARIALRNLGLMGERFIAITPGRSDQPFDTAIVAEGLYDTGIPEVMGLLGNMITELRELVHSLKISVASDSSLQKFNRTIGNLESVSASLAGYMQRNEGKLDQTAQNFVTASQQLTRLLTHNSPKVDSTVERLDRTSTQVEALVMKLDTLAGSARGFARALESEDGTLRLLLEDRRLYDDLRKTAEHLDALVEDIRANPSRYINLKFEVF